MRPRCFISSCSPLMQYISNISNAPSGELWLSTASVLPSAVVRGRRSPLHSGLAHRLRRARQAACLSFDSIADAAGLTAGTTVFNIERKPGHVPRLDTVEKIASALGLSPGFLAYGLDGDNPAGEGLHAHGIGERLRTARQERGLTMRALARLAGLTDTAVRTTETESTMPTVATVEALAKALTFSPAWLAFNQGPRELPERCRAAPAADAKHP